MCALVWCTSGRSSRAARRGIPCSCFGFFFSVEEAVMSGYPNSMNVAQPPGQCEWRNGVSCIFCELSPSRKRWRWDSEYEANQPPCILAPGWRSCHDRAKHTAQGSDGCCDCLGGRGGGGLERQLTSMAAMPAAPVSHPLPPHTGAAHTTCAPATLSFCAFSPVMARKNYSSAQEMRIATP